MKTRVLAVLAILAAACSGTQKPQQQGSVVKEAQAVTAVDSSTINKVASFRSTYRDLVKADSVADIAASRSVAIGLSPDNDVSGFCDRYTRTSSWVAFSHQVEEVPYMRDSLGINADTLRRHFASNVGILASTMTKISFGNNGEIPLHGHSECNGETDLGVVTTVLEWAVQSGVNPDSVGLNAKSVRHLAGRLLAADIRDALKKGEDGILVCECESMIPWYFQKYKFTRSEMGLTEEEWRKATTRPKG